jgi:hypothetical protein
MQNWFALQRTIIGQSFASHTGPVDLDSFPLGIDEPAQGTPIGRRELKPFAIPLDRLIRGSNLDMDIGGAEGLVG